LFPHYEEPQFINIKFLALKKSIINRGLGDASQNAKIQSSLDELSIAGQRGVLTRSKAITAFKLREKHQ
jgi:ribosomal protein L5